MRRSQSRVVLEKDKIGNDTFQYQPVKFVTKLEHEYLLNNSLNEIDGMPHLSMMTPLNL